MKKLVVLFVVVLVFMSLSADDHAELMEHINQAQRTAGSKNYREAKQELTMALNAISLIQLEILNSYLPSAPAGWTEEEMEGTDLGAFGFGMFAGLSATKRYQNGEKDLYIEIMMDSPMIGTLRMFFDNPMFLKSDPNNKIVTVKGQRALLNYDKNEKSGELSIIIGSSVIAVKGSEGVTSEDLTTFMNRIDIDGISKKLM